VRTDLLQDIANTVAGMDFKFHLVCWMGRLMHQCQLLLKGAKGAH